MAEGGQAEPRTVVNSIEFHPKNYSAQLQHLQKVWPTGPLAPAMSGHAMSKMAITRWTCAVEGKPFEIGSKVDVLEHVITLPLRHTSILYSIGKRTAFEGEVSPGNVFLCGPTEQYSRGLYRDAFDTFRLYLSDELIAEAIEGTTGRTLSSRVQLFGPHMADDKILLHLMMTAVGMSKENGPVSVMGLESLGLSLAVHLVGRYYRDLSAGTSKSTVPLAPWRLKRVLAYIDARLAHDISLTELSEVAGLSRMHFAAQFKAATGVSPHRYVVQQKIRVARTLLLNPALSIDDVGTALGFKSGPQFNRAFQRVVGVPPGRWRRAVISS